MDKLIAELLKSVGITELENVATLLAEKDYHLSHVGSSFSNKDQYLKIIDKEGNLVVGYKILTTLNELGNDFTVKAIPI